MAGALAFAALAVAGLGPAIWPKTGRPGLSVLSTAGCFAFALLLSVTRRGTAVRTTQGLVFGGVTLPALALVGHGYGVASTDAWAGGCQPWPFASASLAVGGALLLLEPGRGVLTRFSRKSWGGRLVRRLFAPTVAASLALGWWFSRGPAVPASGGAALPPLWVWAALLPLATHLSLLFWVAHLADRREAKHLAEKSSRDARILELRQALDDLTALQSQLITICAWSNRIKPGDDGWVTLEQFLDKRLHLRISHGISDEALSELLGGIEREAWEKEQAAQDRAWERAKPRRATEP